ncbi:MAG TPA: S41 family peptidase [Alphaproteobacteria bacterium]|nr:S41 family peptidase [Alphaproteobacteria bacterium]
MKIKNNLLSLMLATALSTATSTAISSQVWAQDSTDTDAVAATAAPRAVNPGVYEKLDVFAHVLEKIRTSYVEQVTETEVIENAINGMLTSLDPHSSYLKPEDFEDLQQTTKGEFGGLGIEVTMENGLVKVVSPIEDTPAAAAGLESGDYIIRLDNKDVQGLTLKDAVDKMRGAPGSKIKLTVFRESEKRTFAVTLDRAVIKVKPVKSKLMGNGIGYLRITSFNDYTDNSMRDHLDQLQKANKGPLSGLVIDLRNNPGGLLNQAIAVSDDFLQGGEIVSTRGRIEGQNSRYNARPGDVLDGKPIVVLINAGSASAAEIVAGALQDQRRAVLVGTRSFGKGSVQTIFTLPGGAGMRLTTARYYTPSGRSIQAKGIQPDIMVKALKLKKSDLDDDDDVNPSEAALPKHLMGNKVAVVDEVSGTAKRTDLPASIFVEPKVKTPSDTLVNLEGKPDAQLDRAMSIIKTLVGTGQRTSGNATVVPAADAKTAQ